jgi:tRNA threonylcarbamoyladenosine biosynthesis protein TsaB
LWECDNGTFVVILSVDTSTSAGSIVLSNGERLVGEVNVNSEQTHSARLLPGIDVLLKSAGLTLGSVDAFAVICGPGSFTGVRIGLTTIKGLADCFSKPVIPITAFEAWVEKFPEQPGIVVPVIDARRGEVYAAAYRRSEGEISILAPGVVETAGVFFSDFPYPDACFIGSGASQYRELIVGGERPGWSILPGDGFLGRAMTRIAHRKAISTDAVSAAELHAYYLRKSDAELNWKEK